MSHAVDQAEVDGFGVAALFGRDVFGGDAESIVVAVLDGLAREGKIERSVVETAAKDLKLDDPTISWI